MAQRVFNLRFPRVTGLSPSTVIHLGTSSSFTPTLPKVPFTAKADPPAAEMASKRPKRRVMEELTNILSPPGGLQTSVAALSFPSPLAPIVAAIVAVDKGSSTRPQEADHPRFSRASVSARAPVVDVGDYDYSCSLSSSAEEDLVSLFQRLQISDAALHRPAHLTADHPASSPALNVTSSIIAQLSILGEFHCPKYTTTVLAAAVVPGSALAAPVGAAPTTSVSAQGPPSDWEKRWYEWDTWKSRWANLDDPESIVGGLMRTERGADGAPPPWLERDGWRSMWANHDELASEVRHWAQEQAATRGENTTAVVAKATTEVETATKAEVATKIEAELTPMAPVENEANTLPPDENMDIDISAPKEPPRALANVVIAEESTELEAAIPVQDKNSSRLDQSWFESFQEVIRKFESSLSPPPPDSAYLRSEARIKKRLEDLAAYEKRSLLPPQRGYYGLNHMPDPVIEAEIEAEFRKEERAWKKEEKRRRKEERKRYDKRSLLPPQPGYYGLNHMPDPVIEAEIEAEIRKEERERKKDEKRRRKEKSKEEKLQQTAEKWREREGAAAMEAPSSVVAFPGSWEEDEEEDQGVGVEESPQSVVASVCSWFGWY